MEFRAYDGSTAGQPGTPPVTVTVKDDLTFAVRLRPGTWAIGVVFDLDSSEERVRSADREIILPLGHAIEVSNALFQDFGPIDLQARPPKGGKGRGPKGGRGQYSS